MQCLFVRHGEATFQAASDQARPLTERGETQAEMAASWLAANWTPQQIIVSPYLRARQTAGAFLKAFSALSESNSDALTPDTSLASLEQLLDSTAVDQLLLVGHNPLFSYAVSHFCGVRETLAPASMALVELPVIGVGAGRLLWLRHAPNYETIARRQ